MKPLVKLWLVFTFCSVLFVAPQLMKTGTNVVSRTYAEASLRFFSGTSPYLQPQQGDWFKYSPLFGILYYPLAKLAPIWQALLWALVNAGMFWWGLLLWVTPSRRSSWILWGCLILSSMELDGSLRYQQANALIVGLTLWGLRALHEERPGHATFLLTLATNLKLFPAPFWIASFFPLERRKTLYRIGGLLAALVLCLAVPLIWTSARELIQFHEQWYHLLQSDLHSAGLLDLHSVLARKLPSLTRETINTPLAAVTLLLLVLCRIKATSRFPWEYWIGLGLAAILLASPRTESPTFVVIAPLYPLLAHLYIREKGRWWNWVLLAGAAFFITVSFNDVWPKAIWQPISWNYAGKTLGVLALWIACALGCLQSLRRNRLF